MSDSPKDCNGNKNAEEFKKKPFVYPACWSDAVRMDALFALFKERAVNTYNYDSKMNFWQQLIKDYCLHKGDALFNLQELKLAFARGSSLPACLHTVIEQMLKEVKIRTLVDYEYDPLHGWTLGWAFNKFIKQPLGWGDSAEDPTVDYVHLDVIKKFSKDLQNELFAAHQGKILEFAALKQLLDKTSLQLTKQCYYLGLHTLHVQRKIGLEYRQTEIHRLRVHLVKIPSKNDASIEVDESDLYIHKLDVTLTNLMKYLDAIDEEIKENDSKAREFIKQNKRNMAKTYLRKKHLKEKSFEKLSNTLHNIEVLHMQIQEAKCNGKIIDAYREGKNALQNILDESGLSYDNVDEILVQVRDVMDEHNEVQNSLANFNESKDLDNDDLEKELRQIMGEDGIKSPPANIHEKTAAANGNQSAQEPSRSKPRVLISDEELLAMLEDLEVEDETLQSNNSVLKPETA